MEIESLSDEELVELVLLGVGLGSKRSPPGETARALLDRFGGLRGLGRAGLRELRGVRGVGPARARRIQGFVHLARRFACEPLARGRRFRSSRDIFRHFQPTLRDLRKERFLTVLLDGKHRVMGERMISEGSLNASLVHPREVFSPAIRESAGAIVLVHNHPSGDPTPSLEDIEVTQRLSRVGEIVGIRILDHVIIGEDEFTSFVERGLLLGRG